MIHIKRLRLPGILLAAAVSSGPVTVAAQEEDTFDRTPVDCLTLSSVDRTRVLDDQTILFYMRNGKIYRNYMPRKCPGLERHDRFMYEAVSNRLCDIDSITVLEQWGGGLQRGFTCPLGPFHPISEDEIEDLEAAIEEQEEDAPRRRRRDAIEAEPVELPEDAAPSEPAAPEAEAETPESQR
jgi:hypothetical protein